VTNNTNSEFNSRYFGAPSKTGIYTQGEYLQILARYKKRHLLPFIKGIPPNGRILDLGCGKGKTVRLIRVFRPDVTIVAADITDVRAFLPEDVSFIISSADEIGRTVDLNSFDAVVSLHVIEHMVYPNAMFQSIYDILKPGGSVFIETPNWTRLMVPFSPLYFWNDYTHIHPYSRTAIRRAFVEYNFEEVYVTSVSSTGFGTRFLNTRIEEGVIKTGQLARAVVYTPKDSVLRKISNAILDLTIHPVMRDILIGVAKKPMHL